LTGVDTASCPRHPKTAKARLVVGGQHSIVPVVLFEFGMRRFRVARNIGWGRLGSCLDRDLFLGRRCLLRDDLNHLMAMRADFALELHWLAAVWTGTSRSSFVRISHLPPQPTAHAHQPHQFRFPQNHDTLPGLGSLACLIDQVPPGSPTTPDSHTDPGRVKMLCAASNYVEQTGFSPAFQRNGGLMLHIIRCSHGSPDRHHTPNQTDSSACSTLLVRSRQHGTGRGDS